MGTTNACARPSPTAQRAAQSAVRELRDLANGLHPAALADGGLPAALDDLARHSPVDLHLDVHVPRLDPALEFTAWLVIGESVVNAQKHAHATRVAIEVHQHDCQLRIRIRDDGGGAANPDGPGLRGMRDRVEAAGGTLVIDSPAGGGTTIRGGAAVRVVIADDSGLLRDGLSSTAGGDRHRGGRSGRGRH